MTCLRVRLPSIALSVLFAAVAPAMADGYLHANGHAGAPAPVEAEESLLVDALNEVRSHRLDHALSRIETLVQRKPEFRLAQLVYADLLSAKRGGLRAFGSPPGAPADEVAALRDEARARLQHHLNGANGGRVPKYLVQLAASQQRVVVVDVSAARLYIFENRQGEPVLLRDYYASTGKNGGRKHKEGDQKTPIGVYFVTSRILPKDLPDFYGAGAFPVSYPNEWDRRLGRTGYGIWIHGVPSDTYSRAPRASDGCVALANDDLVAISDWLSARSTPVIIANQIDWVDRNSVRAERDLLKAQIEHWRRDWESRDHRRYTRHYSRDFRSRNRDYRGWVSHKRRVNAAKRFIRVGVSDLSVFLYPDVPGLAVVDFEQDYRSSNLSNRVRKRQYWRLEEDGVWRIVFEGVV